MNLFDFDKNLNEYAQRWYDENAEGMTPDEMEDALDRIYLEWQDAVIGALGLTPKKYFEALSDEELLAQFLGYFEQNALPSILIDELCTRHSLTDRIAGLLKETSNEELIETCMQILEELGCRDVYPTYLAWILDPAFDDDLALHACEIVQDEANRFLAELIAAIPSAGDKVRDRISDLIVYAQPCEKGFELLMERLGKGRDLPLYASYLGMYGDPRAIDALKSKAIDCDYVAFMEINNAVERLGGELGIERDFCNDPAYIRIKKGVVNGNREIGYGQEK